MSEELETDAAILDSIGEGDEPATSKGTGDEDTGTQADSAQAAPAADSEQGATGQPGTEQPGKVSGPQDLVGRDG